MRRKKEPERKPDYARIAELERELGIRSDRDIESEILARDNEVHRAIKERHDKARERMMMAYGPEEYAAAKALFVESYNEWQDDLAEQRKNLAAAMSLQY